MTRLQQIVISQIKQQKLRLIGVILLLLIATGFQVLSPWPFKLLIDNVLGNELIDITTPIGSLLSHFPSKESLGIFVVAAYFLITMLGNVVDYIQAYTSNTVISTIIRNFSISAFKNLESFDIGYYRQQDVGDYTYRLSYDASTIGSLIEFGYIPIITNSFYLILTGFILFSMEPRLTVVTFIALPILAWGLRLFNRQISEASQESETRYSTLHSFIQQSLAQLKIVQAYRQESNILTRYKQQMGGSLNADFKLNHLNLLLSLFMGVVISSLYTAVIGFGVFSVFSGYMTAGLLIVYIFYLDNLTQPVISIINAISSLKEDSVRLSRLEDFFDSQHQLLDTGSVETIDSTTIRFQHVEVKGARGELILSDVSCEFPDKSLTFIIGYSGSGKSSLTSLVLRLMNQPDTGDITLGSYSIRDYRLETLRAAMALAPQETILFNDTIKNVIAFGNPEASMEEIKQAAQLAVADKFIEKHSGNYGFKVGERGELLSGGQRQRLCLARAYLKRSPILIVDEVFSHQDPSTRKKMLENFRTFALGRTVLAVTNNFDIVQPTDRVLVLHGGKIVYQGTYQEMQTAEIFSTITNQEDFSEGR